MNEMPATMEQKDALVRVGRNLANFQTLEHLLKELIPTLQMHGTVAEIGRSLESTRKEISKSSLGDLSEDFHSSVFTQLGDREIPDNLNEPVFSFTMRIAAPLAHVKATRARWRKLIVQRNRLVHSQLMEYDLSKSEDCAKLCGVLDTQNLEICAMLEELAALRSNISFAGAAMVEQLKTGKFLEPDPPPADDA